MAARKTNHQRGDYDAFERLYLHHTVASLASRVDFEPSMLENRKRFYPPMSSRRRSSSLTSVSRKKKKKKEPRSLSATPQRTNGDLNRASKRPPSGPSARKAKVNYKGSLSKMIALNNPPKAKRVDESVNSSASTAKIDNKFESPSAPVQSGSTVEDSENDLLSTLLNGSDGVIEPGAFENGEEEEMVFGDTDDSRPSMSLAEQEAALEEALGRAVEEFETAAAMGEEHSVSVGGGVDDEASDLLEAAAKSVASAEELLGNENRTDLDTGEFGEK
mmetsp:Transcript_31029/g.64745  ORF Transcript_31029/g.64745 Transcript_31029/m.64745 type:complete len:275 (-) Transcript_31029:298-1122(-)